MDDGPLSSFQRRSSSASSFHICLLQAIDGMINPQVVSQASQYFRSTEKKATCEGCFARQSICSLQSGMSRAVHPQEFSKVDVHHRHIPVWASHSTFHFNRPVSLFVSVLSFSMCLLFVRLFLFLSPCLSISLSYQFVPVVYLCICLSLLHI